MTFGAKSQAREESNKVTLHNERLIDERDALKQRIQLAADARLTEMEDQFETKITQTRAEAQRRVDVIRIELEQLRRAASGDSCGWEECEDGSFANVETGVEGITELPETLAFARAVRRVDDFSVQEETAKAAQKRAQTVETKRRELDVKLNEARADAHAQREILAGWTISARSIALSLSTHNSALDSTHSNLLSQNTRLSKQNDRLGRNTSKVCHAVASFKVVREALSLAEAMNIKLGAEASQLCITLKKTQEELDGLRSSLTNAVEAEVQPMRAEVSKARDALSRERLARIEERRQLSVLWPAKHLAPVALRRHMQLNDDERSKLIDSARGAAADAEIKREIRQRVADASRWAQATDDYGRKYCVHSDTGEATWEPPAAMLHHTAPVFLNMLTK